VQPSVGDGTFTRQRPGWRSLRRREGVIDRAFEVGRFGSNDSAQFVECAFVLAACFSAALPASFSARFAAACSCCSS
jgi:hypothetical protein